MLHATRGIVLKSVRYGESSLIVTMFTELFGVQSYMVKGARSSRSRTGKGAMLQTANLLDLVVYHKENHRGLQYISEWHADHIYTLLRSDMIRTAIAIYVSELLYRTLKQPEPHPALFDFSCATLLFLDRQGTRSANIPLYFTLQLVRLLGFGIGGRYGNDTPYLDLREGNFMPAGAAHPQWLDMTLSSMASELIRAPDLESASAIPMNVENRRKLLDGCLDFLRWHIPDFTDLKSPAVLHALMA
jgi:DNA repair protein RecO (recombination protein O)